ncbi:LacI family DNA-binding transcriptional regulator [Streptomyces smyrnaeus]|uniref:LacI family DNA-binding transcriptional regulator n=1 Tax=Streptomyces smyrnaeus TaxID=1387713 RepID=A0ABS3XVL5_9ACTN|nr:LacI family DNA-binding transcriptional regulator [Streptomyces smyrnaeus]
MRDRIRPPDSDEEVVAAVNPGSDVTLRDVARASGCSVSTVSRVLANSRPVGAGTARRVREAAERLGYRPNQVARALRSRSTATVGLVLPQITNPFYPTLVRELTHVLDERGRAVLLADCDDDPAKEAARIESLLARQVDALLVVPVDEHRSRPAVTAAAARVPLVLLDRSCGPGVADLVAVDNAAGMALVLDHLAAQGRRRPCYIGADGTASAAAERRAAYETGVESLTPGEPPLLALGDFSAAWGREAVDRLWNERRRGDGPAFDAVVCGNDLIALGAIQRLRQLGADVPGQVAVTGFDDVPPADLADPAVTTVRQPVRDIAVEAVRLLERHLASGHDAGQPTDGERADAGSFGGDSADGESVDNAPVDGGPADSARPGASVAVSPSGARTRHAVRLAPQLVVRASTAPAPPPATGAFGPFGARGDTGNGPAASGAPGGSPAGDPVRHATTPAPRSTDSPSAPLSSKAAP